MEVSYRKTHFLSVFNLHFWYLLIDFQQDCVRNAESLVVQSVLPKLTRVLLVPLNKNRQLQGIKRLRLSLHLAPPLIFVQVTKAWNCIFILKVLFYYGLYLWKWICLSYWTNTVCRASIGPNSETVHLIHCLENLSAFITVLCSWLVLIDSINQHYPYQLHPDRLKTTSKD